MRLKKFLIFSFIIINFVSFNQSYSMEPDVFVQSTVNRASKVLSEDIPKFEKMEQLKIIAKKTVDIKGIGFYSLGNSRKNLNQSQIENYSNLFEDYSKKQRFECS